MIFDPSPRRLPRQGGDHPAARRRAPAERGARRVRSRDRRGRSPTISAAMAAASSSRQGTSFAVSMTGPARSSQHRRTRDSASRPRRRAIWRSRSTTAGCSLAGRADRHAGRSVLPDRACLRAGRRRSSSRKARAGIAPSDWAVDLMEKECRARSGASIRAAATPPASRQVWPFPVGSHSTAMRVVVTESWRHRLVRLRPRSAPPEPVLAMLPGYPARLSPAADGGFWLRLFAPRNRLDRIRAAARTTIARDMMSEVPRDALDRAGACRRGSSFLEPLQCGGVKHDGHPQAVVADPLLRPGRPARSPICSRLPASTAAPTARATASPASSRHRTGVLVASKGGDADPVDLAIGGAD